MPSTYELIKGETLASSAASYTFTAIPSTFTDLVIRASTRLDGVDIEGLLTIQLNGATLNISDTSLYTTYSSGPASYRDSAASSGYPGWSNDGGSTANTFTSVEIYLPNYAVGTQNKQMSSSSTLENNGTQANGTYAALLVSSNTAITSIRIGRQTGGSNFVAGSSFYLYGIKNS
jgi:hypothetical protein